MKDQKKLHFTSSDKGDLRGLCNELNTLEKQCKELVWKNMTPKLAGTVINNLSALEFEPILTDSTIDRGTDAGILGDDTQRFARFKTAVNMMTKSSSEKAVETLSDQIESDLFTLTSLMRKVLRQNGLPPPHPEDLDDLKDRLDEKTRIFLKFFEEEEDKENTDGGKISESAVNFVRNYVVLRTLSEALLLFLVDLGHLTG